MVVCLLSGRYMVARMQEWLVLAVGTVIGGKDSRLFVDTAVIQERLRADRTFIFLWQGCSSGWCVLLGRLLVVRIWDWLLT